jgi:hypothetical protein
LPKEKDEEYPVINFPDGPSDITAWLSDGQPEETHITLIGCDRCHITGAILDKEEGILQEMKRPAAWGLRSIMVCEPCALEEEKEALLKERAELLQQLAALQQTHAVLTEKKVVLTEKLTQAELLSGGWWSA